MKNNDLSPRTRDLLLLMTLIFSLLIVLASHSSPPQPEPEPSTSSFIKDLMTPRLALSELPDEALDQLYLQYIDGMFIDQYGRKFQADLDIPAWSCEGIQGLTYGVTYWVARPSSGREFREAGCA
ncbi:MAG: hypothetical protein M3Q44_07880 [bacterium]|nr:hypothetical protein [bacterium]